MARKKKAIPLLPPELTDTVTDSQLEAIYTELVPEGLKLILEELLRSSEGDKPVKKKGRKKI